MNTNRFASRCWYRYGFERDGYYHIHHDTDQFVFDMVHDEMEIPKFKESINRTMEILDSFPKPLTVFVSGGVDSQFSLEIIHRSGIPYRAVSFHFHGLNAYDVKDISDTAVKIGSTVDRMDMDIWDLHMSGRIHEIGIRYRNNSPHICSHLAMIEDSRIWSGTAVFSGNPPMISTGRVSPCTNYSLFGVERFNDHPGDLVVIPNIFTLSPELTYRFIEESANHSDLEGYSQKIACYHAAGVQVVPQRSKYHGFEILKEAYALYRGTNSVDGRHPYDLDFRDPLERDVVYNKGTLILTNPSDHKYL